MTNQRLHPIVCSWLKSILKQNRKNGGYFLQNKILVFESCFNKYFRIPWKLIQALMKPQGLKWRWKALNLMLKGWRVLFHERPTRSLGYSQKVVEFILIFWYKFSTLFCGFFGLHSLLTSADISEETNLRLKS